MASKDTPCKNCDERYYGCHAKCDRYASFDNERKVEREKRMKACEIKGGFVEHSRELRHKIRQDNNKSKIFRSPKR